MVELESNYSVRGNLPAINNLGAIPGCPHVSHTLPLFDPPYTISHFSSVVLSTGSRWPTLLLLIQEAQIRAKRPVQS
jgi:hypothetical protein